MASIIALKGKIGTPTPTNQVKTEIFSALFFVFQRIISLHVVHMQHAARPRLGAIRVWVGARVLGLGLGLGSVDALQDLFICKIYLV